MQQEISGVSYNIKQKKSSQQRFGSGSPSLSLSKMLNTFLFFTGMSFLNITFQYIFKSFYLHLYLLLYSINISHLNGLQTGRYFCCLLCHFLLLKKIVVFINKFSNSNHIRNKIVKIVYSCIVIVMIKIIIIIAIIIAIIIIIIIISIIIVINIIIVIIIIIIIIILSFYSIIY